MAWLPYLSVLALCLVPSVRSAAVSSGGCRPQICAQYSAVTLDQILFEGGDYMEPSTWQRGWLPRIGFLLGQYNRAVSSGAYDTKGLYSVPWLNLERYDLETSLMDSSTGRAYATASAEQTLDACCHRCAATEGCHMFQFFPGATPAGNRCYLLSGGSDKAKVPGSGAPYAGSRQDQVSGSRRHVPMSFLGLKCHSGGTVQDDPHFMGDHGVPFDFHGALNQSFCFVTDSSLQVNALLQGYRDNRTDGDQAPDESGLKQRTWVRELGILWRDAQGAPHALHMVARSGKDMARGPGFIASIDLDGQPQAPPRNIGDRIQDGMLTFELTGLPQTEKEEREEYALVLKDTASGGPLLNMSITMRPANPNLQSDDDAWIHFNLNINTINVTEAVHGVLGQTYRDTLEQVVKSIKYSFIVQSTGKPVQADKGQEGEGFLEGQVDDYVTPSVTSPDCNVSTFVKG